MDRIELLEAIADDNFLGPKMHSPSPEAIMEGLGIFQGPIVKRGKLRFMIGLQRSGKSTWATNWMRGTPRTEDGIVFPRVVVCADNIRLAVTGERYNKRAEPTVFMVKDYMIESLLARGHDVLVDGTHTTRESIRRNLEIDIDASWTLINTPVEVCKERAIATGQPDLVPVLDRTGAQLAALLSTGIPSVVEKIRQDVMSRWPKRDYECQPK